jgi:hypothetical protein
MGEFVADRGCVIFAPIASEFKPPVKTRKTLENAKFYHNLNTIWLDRENRQIVSGTLIQ